MPTCSVTGCLDRHEKKSGFSFYSFPSKNKIILEKWIIYCQKEDSWIPKKSSKICGRHFEENCFQDRPDIRRLKEDVFPSVENFLSSGNHYSDFIGIKVLIYIVMFSEISKPPNVNSTIVPDSLNGTEETSSEVNKVTDFESLDFNQNGMEEAILDINSSNNN